MTDFSVIIPVYNAQRTLRACLDSLLAQTHSSFEVIMIDDGSTDDSYRIAEEYQKRDARFKAFRQKNSGPSAARNVGLDQADGTYICFVDSDDTVQPQYLERLQAQAAHTSADMIFIGYYKVDESQQATAMCVPEINAEHFFEKLLMLSDKDMFGYTWIKSVKREAIGEVRFRLDLNLFEDEVFTCEVLNSCRNIEVIGEPLYNYTVGVAGALTTKTHADYCRKCDEVFLAWQKLLMPFDGCESALQHMANRFVARCRYYGLERDVNVKRFFGELADTAYFVQHTNITKSDEYIRKRRYGMLCLQKLWYVIKQKLVCVWRRHV